MLDYFDVVEYEATGSPIADAYGVCSDEMPMWFLDQKPFEDGSLSTDWLKVNGINTWNSATLVEIGS